MPEYLQTTGNLFLRMKNTAIDQLDIFGQLPSFRVMSKQKYNSLIGLVTTLMIGGITMIYLASELTSMLNKSEPSVVSTEIQVFDTTTYALENDNFTLAVSVTDAEGKSLLGNGKYYNITVSRCARTRIKDPDSEAIKIDKKCIILPTETCNLTHFSTELQIEYFKKMKLGAMQCINREYLKVNAPQLQGQLNAMVFQYLEIQMEICQNSTTHQLCAPLEEIEHILMSGRYIAYTSEYLMQLSNPQTPYQQIINSDFSGFSISTSKIIQQYYRIIETTSDNGLLLPSITTQTNLKLQERRETTEFYNQKYIVNHFIGLDYRSTQYSRTYIKIQGIFSKIGGIWQIFIIIVATIIRPFINNQMNIEIANKIYRFQSDKQQNACQTTDNQHMDMKNSDKINEQSKMYTVNDTEHNDKLPNDIQSTLQIMLGCNKRKKKLFENAKSQIMDNLDMIQIIQKLHELELLKSIMLSKEQSYLFSILPKPLISLKEGQPDSNHKESQFQQDTSHLSSHITFVSHLNQTSKSKSKLNQHLESYIKITNNKRKTSLDERLISLFDKQTIDLFEKSIFQIHHNSKSPCAILMESKEEDINEPIPLLPK